MVCGAGVGGVWGRCGGRRCVPRRRAHPVQARLTGPAYMSMATTTLVRAAMTHAVTNM